MTKLALEKYWFIVQRNMANKTEIVIKIPN